METLTNVHSFQKNHKQNNCNIQLYEKWNNDVEDYGWESDNE